MVKFYVVNKPRCIFQNRSTAAMRARPIERASKTDVVTILSGDIRHYVRRRDDVAAVMLRRRSTCWVNEGRV